MPDPPEAKLIPLKLCSFRLDEVFRERKGGGLFSYPLAWLMKKLTKAE
jgi:hypothetical protein